MSGHWAMAYLGKAYAIHGVGPDAFNCWSFFRHVQAERWGRAVPEVPNPDSLLGAARLFKTHDAARHWQAIPLDRAVEGDGLLLGRSFTPAHVGIVLEDFKVLHCVEEAGVVCQTLTDLKVGGWNIAGVYAYAA